MHPFSHRLAAAMVRATSERDERAAEQVTQLYFAKEGRAEMTGPEYLRELRGEPWWDDDVQAALKHVQSAKATMPESAKQDVENAEGFLQSALAKAAQSGEKAPV